MVLSSIVGTALGIFGLDSYTNYLILASIPISWVVLSKLNKNQVRDTMYKAGRNISQKCKKTIPGWDNYVEPAFIQQFDTIFTAAYALTRGMISDNENQKEIQEKMENLDKHIQQDIEEF